MKHYNLEWSFKPIIYWLSIITGVKLNRTTNDSDRSKLNYSHNNLNRFLTFFSTLVFALNICHAIYYSYLLSTGRTRSILNKINSISDDSTEALHKNSTSAEMISRMIDMADHIIFIFGTGLVFYIISFSKLRGVWSSMLKIEQQMVLDAHHYNRLRKIAIIGFLFMLVVI